MLNIKSIKNQNILFWVLLNIVVIVSYYKIFNGFFQQDEWLAFNRLILLQKSSWSEVMSNILVPTGAHYTPLNLLILLLTFVINKFNFFSYAVTSLLLHVITVNIVFYLYTLLFKNRLFAFLSATFFGVLAASSQATSWVIADSGTHISTIWGLFSLIFAFIYLSQNKKIFLIFSIGSIMISLLYKELTIGLFITLPILIHIYNENKKVPWKTYLLIIILGVLFLLSRIISSYLFSIPALVASNNNQSTILLNLITAPIKSFAQILVLPDKFLFIVNGIYSKMPVSIVKNQDPFYFLQFSEKRLLEIFNLFLVVTLLIAARRYFIKSDNEQFKRNIKFSFIFVIINSLVFSFAPERNGVIHILDSRNLYFTSFGAILFLSSLTLEVFRQNINRATGLLVVLIAVNVYWLNDILRTQEKIGKERESILTTIKDKYPVLAKKVAFYTESDTSLYGLSSENRILPFQSGFGQTLLVWYEVSENFPNGFFKDKFLWGITDQGYKEAGDRGFGYFRDFNLLADTVLEKQLPFDSVVAYQYDSNAKLVLDISEEVRDRLRGFAASGNERIVESYKIHSSNNPIDMALMVDKDRTTYWDSKEPYIKTQTIEIDLGITKTVLHIKIDSYNNKDQDKVGYEVLTSNNYEEWTRTFYSKITPPNKDGFVDLYIPPKKARFIRIKQIGNHKYASWVVHELHIFETALDLSKQLSY